MANLYFMKVWAVGGSGKPEVILNEGELCENRFHAWGILLERIYRYPFPHQYVICSVKRDVLIGLELPMMRAYKCVDKDGVVEFVQDETFPF